MKTPEARVQAALAAFDLLFLLDLSKFVPAPTEGNEDLAELEKRMEKES